MTDGPTPSLLFEPLLARCTFPPKGSPVSLAVSGGADSMALLLLAYQAELHITAIHIDHQLRSESASDADIIRAVTEPRDIPLVVHTVQVGDGPNLEARARNARYAMFPSEIMTGHTEDDQAETVLINLLRGAGAQGLSAMRPGLTRPLLRIRREETRSLCASLNITTVEDLTNTDPRFLRNRVRHELIPLMSDLSQRDPVPLLARTADVLRGDNDLLDELARSVDPTDAKALAAAPTPLAHRALRQWLSDPYPPDLATLERILTVARGDVLACDIGENRQIRRSKQRLTLHILG